MSYIDNHSAQEVYEIHNSVMAKCHRHFIEIGRTDLAYNLQSLADSIDGSFMLHDLVHVAILTGYEMSRKE